MPCFLKTEQFAYFRGKRLAKKQAKSFASGQGQSAVVFEPGVVVGKRYLSRGKAIALDKFLAPFLKLLPSQFVKIEALAQRIAQEAVDLSANQGFKSISHIEI